MGGSEDALFSKIAVVRLEHSVTAVCPENGEIQYTTIIPDKNIEYTGKVVHSKAPLTASHNVDKFEYRTRDNSFSIVHKSLLQRQTASYGPELSKINNKSQDFLPGGNDMATSRNMVLGESSRSRKRKNPEKLDSESDDEKKPRKNKQWSETSMQEAITAVRNGMRVRRAAKVFVVPRTTLKYKLDGRSPLSHNTDGSRENISEKIADATKEYMKAKELKEKSLSPQGKQTKDKISPETRQKNSDTNKPTVASCEKNRVMSSNHDVPVHQTRSLRSNANILEKRVVIPLEKKTESSKNPVDQQTNKIVKETNTPGSKLKNCKANQSSCGKDSKSRKEQKISENEEVKLDEKKCFKLWSEESMENAIHAVEKGSKIREAANKFGIPRSTLGRRLATAAFKKPHLLSKSDLQANVSGTQFVGVRQSPRRHKTSSVQETAQEAPGIQPSDDETLLRIKEESIRVQKEVNVEEKTVAAKKKNRYKVNWSEESMKKALAAVDQGMSLCSAAKKFNLPHASLKTRKYKQSSMNTKNVGPEPHISSEDEDHIVNYVNDCATFGIVNVKQVGLLLTGEAAEKKLIWNIKKQGLPSDDWWDAFCSRRGNHFKNVDFMQPHQTIKLTEARLSLFYDKLLAIKNSSQYHKVLNNCSDCRTFTLQEFKYDLDNVTQWVSDSHGEDACACRRPETDPENKLISTICCASAAGNSIPPMFVYHTENNYKIPATGLVGPFGALHFVHDVKDLTRKSDFYFKWFEEVFLKYAHQSRPLIMLFDPDTAVITPEFIQLAQKNEIMLLGLPPFSAHVTQPLNRTVSPALKKGFTFTSSLFKRIFVKGVHFNNFARCFKVAWNSSVDAAVIKTGFAEAGIHPIDRKVLLKLKPF